MLLSEMDTDGINEEASSAMETGTIGDGVLVMVRMPSEFDVGPETD